MRLDIEQELKKQLREYEHIVPEIHETESTEWGKVIEATLEEYRKNGEPGKADLLALRYIHGCPQEKVQEILHIGRGTYWKWKREVFATLGLKAAWRHLIVP